MYHTHTHTSLLPWAAWCDWLVLVSAELLLLLIYCGRMYNHCKVSLVNLKVHTFDIAPLHSESPPQKRSGMARVIKGFHSFTCTPTRSSAIGMSHTCLCLPSRSWYSFTDPGLTDCVGRLPVTSEHIAVADFPAGTTTARRLTVNFAVPHLRHWWQVVQNTDIHMYCETRVVVILWAADPCWPAQLMGQSLLFWTLVLTDFDTLISPEMYQCVQRLGQVWWSLICCWVQINIQTHTQTALTALDTPDSLHPP